MFKLSTLPLKSPRGCNWLRRVPGSEEQRRARVICLREITGGVMMVGSSCFCRSGWAIGVAAVEHRSDMCRSASGVQECSRSAGVHPECRNAVGVQECTRSAKLRKPFGHGVQCAPALKLGYGVQCVPAFKFRKGVKQTKAKRTCRAMCWSSPECGGRRLRECSSPSAERLSSDRVPEVVQSAWCRSECPSSVSFHQ